MFTRSAIGRKTEPAGSSLKLGLAPSCAHSRNGFLQLFYDGYICQSLLVKNRLRPCPRIWPGMRAQLLVKGELSLSFRRLLTAHFCDVANTGQRLICESSTERIHRSPMIVSYSRFKTLIFGRPRLWPADRAAILAIAGTAGLSRLVQNVRLLAAFVAVRMNDVRLAATPRSADLHFPLQFRSFIRRGRAQRLATAFATICSGLGDGADS